MIDFKEIPEAHKPSGEQDSFELFARELFQALGFRILEDPARGRDSGKDLIIEETRTGKLGASKVKWLVSCKHKAHSGKSVRQKDELDIENRINQHSCRGFIGFYSTIPEIGLQQRLEKICRDNSFELKIYDVKRIEGVLFDNIKLQSVFQRFFPDSYSVRLKKANPTQSSKRALKFDREELLELNRTAIVTLEIDKIEREFLYSSKENEVQILSKIDLYSNIANFEICSKVIGLVKNITESSGATLSYKTIDYLFHLILVFDGSWLENKSQVNYLTSQIIEIGSRIAYGSYRVGRMYSFEMSLSIIKLCVRINTLSKNTSESNQIDEWYEKLLEEINSQNHLPHNNDFKLLLGIYKNDLKINDISHPPLPDDLYKKIQDEYNSET